MMTASRGHTASGSLTQLSSEAPDITALFPRDAYSDGIEHCQEILEAREDCKARRDGGFVTGDVAIVDDKELQGQVVAELVGPGARLTFQTRAGVQPLLVAYAKCLDKFFSIDVNVVDGDDNYYTFSFSNRRSVAAPDTTGGVGGSGETSRARSNTSRRGRCLDESVALVEFSKQRRSARAEPFACAHMDVGSTL